MSRPPWLGFHRCACTPPLHIRYFNVGIRWRFSLPPSLPLSHPPLSLSLARCSNAQQPPCAHLQPSLVPRVPSQLSLLAHQSLSFILPAQMLPMHSACVPYNCPLAHRSVLPRDGVWHSSVLLPPSFEHLPAPYPQALCPFDPLRLHPAWPTQSFQCGHAHLLMQFAFVIKYKGLMSELHRLPAVLVHRDLRIFHHCGAALLVQGGRLLGQPPPLAVVGGLLSCSLAVSPPSASPQWPLQTWH